MATHRPAHARSGLGRYTAPRRLHPAHAAPSADGVRVARLAAAVIAGGALAGAGLLGLVGTPAGAEATLSGTSPPLSSLGTTFTDGSGNTATLAGGGLAEADATAGEVDISGHAVDNTAFSDSFGLDTMASSTAGEAEFANASNNFASSTALGEDAAASSFAGEGDDADASNNSAVAWTFSGEAISEAGLVEDAHAVGNVAWAGSQFGEAGAYAGLGDDAGLSGNVAYAYAFGGESGSFAGIGSGHRNDNLAISQGLGAGALACSGTESDSVGQGGCDEGESDVVTADVGNNGGDPSHNLASASGAGGGLAIAFATDGSNNQAAALAVGDSEADATALGTGDEASATALGGEAPTSANADAEGTDADADASAQGAGSETGASASATQTPTESSVEAASGLGGDAFASNSGGLWTVSLNGATLVG